MNKEKFVSVALTVAVLGGCSPGAESESREAPPAIATREAFGPLPAEEPAGPEMNDADAEKRLGIANKWIGTARKVAEQTGNKQAKDLASLLDASGLIRPVSETESQIIAVSGVPGAPYIQPIIAEDAKLGDHYGRQGMFAAAVATYNPEANIITINDTLSISDTFQGIVLLHEALHAQDFMVNRYDWKDPQVFAAHEVMTHLFENELLSQLGGSRYGELISRYAADMAGDMAASRVDGAFEFRTPTRYISELDEIFGPAASELERELRLTHVWIDAAFRAMDRYFADEERAFTAKVNLMREIYQEHGITD